MTDQASKLRQLATDSPPAARASSDAPPIVVVMGARPGVGTTTIVANLGAVLADAGLQTVLLDAACDGTALAIAVGIGLLENKTSRLQVSPSGAMLVTHYPNNSDDGDSPRGLVRRWNAVLSGIGQDVNLVVVDAGCHLNAVTRRLWRFARLVLLVTTPDDPAVMDAYAKIKLANSELTGELRVLVNSCDNPSVARRVVERIAAASERFLGQTVKAAPALPPNTIQNGRERLAPRVWDTPANAFGHATLWLGRSVIESLAAEPAAVEACVAAA